MSVPPRYEVIGVEGLPEIGAGEALSNLIARAAAAQGTPFAATDLLVISQKIVSKAEGRIVRLAEITPSPETVAMAEELGRDARLIEVILRESRRVVRRDKGVLIVETHQGWICANAGVDQSNVDADTACLLPEDSDRSARELRDRRYVRQTVARGADQRRDRRSGPRAAQELSGREGSGRPRAAGDHPGAG